MAQDEPLGGWRLKRTIDGVDKSDYRLDQNYVLRAGAKAKVVTPMPLRRRSRTSVSDWRTFPDIRLIYG